MEAQKKQKAEGENSSIFRLYSLEELRALEEKLKVEEERKKAEYERLKKAEEERHQRELEAKKKQEEEEKLTYINDLNELTWFQKRAT